MKVKVFALFRGDIPRRLLAGLACAITIIQLLSACAAPAGKAAGNPAGTPLSPSAAAPTPSVTAEMTVTQTSSPQPATPAATATPAASGTPAATLTAQPTVPATPTPFPSASPTALLEPTQAAAIPPTARPPTVTPIGAPTATPAPPDTLLDQNLPRRVKVGETAHYIFYAQDNYIPVDLAWWSAQAEVVYAYDSQRLNGAQVKHKISLAFLAPEKRACPIRGLASESGSPMILIYADQSSPRPYLLAVLSHEVGHAISFDGFPEGLPGNIALAEGLATWTSGKYWAAWKNVRSLDDLVRGYLNDGTYEAIHENTDMHGVYPWQNNNNPPADCLARRDKVYTEWASFVGYLIDTYGWDKAHRLFRLPKPVRQNGQVITFPPDYRGIYGKALNQLEWEWLAKLSLSG